MARKILIAKVGGSTVVDIKEDGTNITETLVFNDKTNLTLRNGIIKVGSNNFNETFQFQFDDLENKLSTANARAYITAAATANLFS